MENKFLHLAGVILAAASTFSVSPDTRVRPMRPLLSLPALFVSSDPNDVRFFLFPDPANPNSTDEIIYGDDTTLGRYDPSKPTTFLTHGFQSNGLNEASFPGNVKNAYLIREIDHSQNVITVDWGKLATPAFGTLGTAFYSSAVSNVEVVGKRLGNFLSWLNNQSLIDVESTHLVGHSLGAHISGWAGQTVTEQTGKTVGRITALDPAGPLFNIEIAARAVKTSDAQFIDAYHTSAGTFGIVKPLGSVDFYVNGGFAPQPGCSEVACSHSRSHQYFTQTILEGDPARNPNNATQCACVAKLNVRFDPKCCDTKLLFGEFCSPGTTGPYNVRYELNNGDAPDS